MNVDMEEYRGELKEAAAAFIASGLPITVAEGKNPGSVMGAAWQQRRLTADEAVTLIDVATHPTLGIMHGTGGSIVVDIDSESERRAFLDLFDDAPPVMATDTTGREGGEHRHAAFHPRLSATGAAVITYSSPVGDKVTFRIGADGKGAHSVVAPSLHAIKANGTWQWSGKRYQWVPGCSLDDVGLVDVPETVVDKLLAAHAKANAPMHGAVTPRFRPDAEPP
jgi:hypothetical protein